MEKKTSEMKREIIVMMINTGRWTTTIWQRWVATSWNRWTSCAWCGCRTTNGCATVTWRGWRVSCAVTCAPAPSSPPTATSRAATPRSDCAPRSSPTSSMITSNAQVLFIHHQFYHYYHYYYSFDYHLLKKKKIIIFHCLY